MTKKLSNQKNIAVLPRGKTVFVQHFVEKKRKKTVAALKQAYP